MKQRRHFFLMLMIFCFLATGCTVNQEIAQEEPAVAEDAELVYSKYLLRNYYIEGGCKKQGTIRDNTAWSGSSNGWTIRSFNETAENLMAFDILQILDITTLEVDGIDKLIFSRLRNIDLDLDQDLALRNINTLSMLVFLQQTIGETNAGFITYKQSYLEDLELFPKSKSKIKSLRKLIRSNADVACDVIFEMGAISNIGSLSDSEQKKLDKIDKSLRKVIGFNGIGKVTEVEMFIANAHAEGEVEKIKQEIEGEKRAIQSQKDEQEYLESLENAKPRCVEYPSDNPKYVIVKCTNLP